MRRKARGRSRHGTKVVALFAIVAAFAAAVVPAPVPAVPRFLATLLWVLCLLPLYVYLGHHSASRRPLPFLAAISVIFGLYYALPLTIGITDNYYNAPVDARTDYHQPVQLAFLGWVLMMSGYVVASVFIKDRKPAREFPWRPGFMATAGLALFAGSTMVSVAKAWLGYSIITGGIFQFVVSLQWLGAGLLMLLARRGELSPPAKIAAVGIGLVSVGLLLAGGSIAPLAMLFAVIGFGAWIGKPSIQLRWLVAALVIGLAATSFRGVAIDFRRTVWFGSQNLSQEERLKVMLELLGMRIERDGYLGTIKHGIEVTAERSANLDLLANVVRRTPSEVPFWNGQTYLSLAGSFVPRFMWPDKPTKELGQAFGHRYRFIYWTNTSTAINLPVLVEFFINFSTLGVIIGMGLVGVIYRILDVAVNRPGQNPLVSMMGAVLLLPLLMIESDFSLVFGGLPLNAIALGLIWFVLTRGAGSPSSARRAGARLAPRRPPGPVAASSRIGPGMPGQ